MSTKTSDSLHRKWGRFRYAVVGHLLRSPPESGLLRAALIQLASKTWKHPITGEDTQFAFSTIEGWYYRVAKQLNDPITPLNRMVRKDKGQRRTIWGDVEAALRKQYAEYSWWTVQLHAKNLRSRLKHGPIKAPSYSSVLRYMKSHGLKRKSRPTINENGELENLASNQEREIACFEAAHVNQLWSLDFHVGKLRVLAVNGDWLQPICLAVLDHFSRLICHIIWGFFEQTQDLVGAVSTAIMKRGRPRVILSDNGAAMRAGEFTQGLGRLGIEPRKIKPRAAYQNGKTEFLWNPLESELIAMLLGQKNLTLAGLNQISQAWAEMGHNREFHREIKQRPIDRFISGNNVGLNPVDEQTLRRAFRIEEARQPRSSDGTIRIQGTLFRLPQRFWHLEQVTVRYARWDLSFVHLVDNVSGKELDRIFPVDKLANADGKRRLSEGSMEVSQAKTRDDLPPLLQELITQYESLTRIPITTFIKNKDKI